MAWKLREEREEPRVTLLRGVGPEISRAISPSMADEKGVRAAEKPSTNTERVQTVRVREQRDVMMVGEHKEIPRS